MLDRLLALQPELVYRGESVAALQTSMKKLEILEEKFLKMNTLTLNKRIKHHCKKQRNKVKRAAEAAANAYSTSDQLKMCRQFEQACMRQADTDLRNEQGRIQLALDRTNEFITRSSRYLEQIQLDRKSVHLLLEEAAQMLSELCNDCADLKRIFSKHFSLAFVQQDEVTSTSALTLSSPLGIGRSNFTRF
jgi:hypothetical protein